MSDKEQEELVSHFRSWIYTQQRSHCTMDSNERSITIETPYAKAEIRFYEMNIVEFRIVPLGSEDTIFYLHFQLNDMRHAQELFSEMMSALIAYTDAKPVKILLCCTSALTTSYFAEALNNAAKVLSLNYTFEAVSYDRVYERGLYYDVILLAPQVGFQQNKIHNAMKEIPITTIPAGIYGKYDAGALIVLVQKILREHKPKQTKAEVIASKFENSAKILCIGVFNSSRHIRTIYRYYRNGTIVKEGEIKKKNISLADVKDIIDTMVALYPEIECIGLTMPGTEIQGSLHLPEAGIAHENVAMEIYHKYHRICVLSNDCNQIAYGIYNLEERYKDLVFNFQPYGSAIGGAGLIANGQLVRGRGNNAGELLPLQGNLDYSQPLEILARTADGTYEILAKTIAAEIALVAPEAVFVHAAMAPDIDHLRLLVEQMVPKESMPDFYYLEDTREYMMVGTMLKALDQIDEYRHDGWGADYYK